MNIIREKVFFGVKMEQETSDIGMAVLDNGVWLLIHEDGSATGSDEKQYFCVSKEVQSKPIYADETLLYICESWDDFDKEPAEALPIPDTDLETLGWTTDADKPIITC